MDEPLVFISQEIWNFGHLLKKSFPPQVEPLFVINKFYFFRWLNAYPIFLETKFKNLVSSRNLTTFIILRIKFSLFHYCTKAWPFSHSQKTKIMDLYPSFSLFFPPMTLLLYLWLSKPSTFTPWFSKKPKTCFPYSPSASSCGDFKIPFLGFLDKTKILVSWMEMHK